MQRQHLIKEYFIANNLLLFCLLGFLLTLPLFPVPYHPFIFNFFLFAIMFSAVFSFDEKRRKLLAGVAAVLTIGLFIADFLSFETFNDFFRIAISMFFIWAVIGLIRQTVREKRVTQMVIVDSISGYLLLGVIYVIIVKLIYQLNPGSYRFPDTGDISASRYVDVIYYTFVTYTTTGYGDVLPAGQFAKSFAILIGASGQLYVAIIIALLVGKFSSATISDQ